MKTTSTLVLVLILTLSLVKTQDLKYFSNVDDTRTPKSWNANEGQMLRHISAKTIYYTGNEFNKP